MVHCCFKQDCELEVQYVCQCLSFVTYSCESHLQMHLQLPNRTHSLDSVLTEPSELTKDTIIKFLAKEKAKKEKLKSIALAFFSQNSQNSININLNDLNSDLEEISCLIEKISQISEEYSLNSLKTQHDTDIKESINCADEYAGVTLFCQLGQLRNKRFEILYKANNDQETEQDFRKTCSLYENNANNSLLNQAYQEYIKEYQKIASNYLISDKANLYIYNTETEKEVEKVLEAKVRINSYKFLAQIPNGELFFIDSKSSSAFILDKNYQIRKMPFGVPNNCLGCIYFNRSVYCFGGNIPSTLNSSRKFDLDQNRWTQLAIMRKMVYNYFNSVVFNRKILISIDENSEILLYSIDIDTFSEIPYSFGGDVKILINGEKRLYLIECYRSGYIYESEVNNEYNWKKIAKSKLEETPGQVYCNYNKGGIYISILYNYSREYFKFDLNQKRLIDISFYSENLGLKRSGEKLKAIKKYENTFILNPNHAAIYVDKGYTLYYIVKRLEEIEKSNNDMNRYRGNKDSKFYTSLSLKGINLMNLGRYLEAIECYNETINVHLNASVKGHKAAKIKDCLVLDYMSKGIALFELGMYLESIECYNASIKLESYTANVYFYKGNALQKVNRHHQAIECYKKATDLGSSWAEPYNSIGISLQNLEKNLDAIEYYNKAIKYSPQYVDAYNNKGNILLKIGRSLEAIECYNEAIKLVPDCADYYLNKGEALYNLDRNIEAIECYNEAIKHKIDEPVFYRNRANALSRLGRQTEALQDFNKADDLIKSKLEK